jgi:SAM-dependent methyltransferase
MTDSTAPSQFYTGLVADLYEPLASERSRATDYVPFLERTGTPALELACGSGLPLLDLVALGYEVEGLDASADMLARCRASAAARDLRVTLHQAEMQAFALPRRYRAIFLAGASFTLLTSDADAAAALACIHAHLEPGGSVMIPLEISALSSARRAVGRWREHAAADGSQLRFGVIAASAGADERTLVCRVRYERLAPGRAPESLERDWVTRWWAQDQFREMLHAAGFAKVTLVAPDGGRSGPGDRTFTALARRD